MILFFDKAELIVNQNYDTITTVLLDMAYNNAAVINNLGSIEKFEQMIVDNDAYKEFFDNFDADIKPVVVEILRAKLIGVLGYKKPRIETYVLSRSIY
ncbi:MAG: hypothetical protein R2771_09715 [Saprospiraceae bacterium]